MESSTWNHVCPTFFISYILFGLCKVVRSVVLAANEHVRVRPTAYTQDRHCHVRRATIKSVWVAHKANFDQNIYTVLRPRDSLNKKATGKIAYLLHKHSLQQDQKGIIAIRQSSRLWQCLFLHVVIAMTPTKGRRSPDLASIRQQTDRLGVRRMVGCMPWH